MTAKHDWEVTGIHKWGEDKSFCSIILTCWLCEKDIQVDPQVYVTEGCFDCGLGDGVIDFNPFRDSDQKLLEGVCNGT